MNKNLPKKAKDIKGAVAISELCRAHWIIIILALSFAAMLCFVSQYEVQFDGSLSTIAVVLLVLVAAISFATVVALQKRK